MITIIGAIFIVLAGAFLIFRPDLLQWLLSAAIPFSATAGFNLAGQSIAVYSLVAIVIALVGYQSLRLRGLLAVDLTAKPGLRPLLAFGAWAVVVTAVCPLIFYGSRVIRPRDGIDYGVKNPAELVPTLSNAAQVIYLLLGILTVAAIGSSRKISPNLPAAGFTIGTIASSLKSLLPENLQQTIFDNSANFAYTSGSFNGIERLRGVFSEPAALGAFSVAAGVFFFVSASKKKGLPCGILVALGLWASTNAVLSFSAGALVSGIVILSLVSGKAALSILTGRKRMSEVAIVATLLAMPTLVIVGPTIVNYVDLLLGDKTDTTSYENRNAADSFSIELAKNVYGIGVGVGSNRPSSFFASLLASVGILGLALLAIAMLIIAVQAMRQREFHSVVWALVAILVSKIVAGPDLSDPAMWFLLAVCAGAAWTGDRDTMLGGDHKIEQSPHHATLTHDISFRNKRLQFKDLKSKPMA